MHWERLRKNKSSALHVVLNSGKPTSTERNVFIGIVIVIRRSVVIWTTVCWKTIHTTVLYSLVGFALWNAHLIDHGFYSFLTSQLNTCIEIIVSLYHAHIYFQTPEHCGIWHLLCSHGKSSNGISSLKAPSDGWYNWMCTICGDTIARSL